LLPYTTLFRSSLRSPPDASRCAEKHWPPAAVSDALAPVPPAMPDSDSAIDVVYTWVDGTRAEYLSQLGRHAQGARDLTPERYRDADDCLRHSLRSLELHAPWVRTVYLVTCRPQVPAWLRLDHPRLRIVHHDEIMTPDYAQPTFNSNVIETALHRIPGISKRFVYFNDDY